MNEKPDLRPARCLQMRKLSGRNQVLSLCRNKCLVGFGRTTSDGIHRSVEMKWLQATFLGRGPGRRVVEALPRSSTICQVFGRN